jgi:serine/threonine-protein kinase
VRRHRAGVAAGTLVAAAMGASIAAIVWQSHIARTQATIASQEARKANAVKDFLLDIFNQNSEAHPEGAQARLTSAEELLDIASHRILSKLDEDPDVRLELMATMGQLNLTLEKYPQVEALHRERVRLATERFGPNDARVAAALMDLAVFLRQRGQTADARRTIEEALGIMDALGDRSSLMRGHAQARLAQIVYMQSAAPDPTPIEYYKAALEVLERLPPSDQLVDATLGLARSYELARRWEDAIEANLRGIELSTRINGPQSIAVGGGHQQMARCLARLNRLDEAERSLEHAIEVFTFVVGRDNGYTISARRDAAAMKQLRGKHRDVIDELESVLAILLAKDGPTNHWVNQARLSLARALIAVGRFDRARVLLDDGIQMSAQDPKRQVRVALLQTRAELAREQGRLDDALRDLDLARQVNQELSGSQDQLVAALLAEKGDVLVSARRFDDAVALLDEAGRLLANTETDVRGPERLRVAIALAAADSARGRHDDARNAARKVLAEIDGQTRPDELWLLQERAHRIFGAASLALNEREVGCRALESALSLRRCNSLPGDARLQGSEAAFAEQGCNRS